MVNVTERTLLIFRLSIKKNLPNSVSWRKVLNFRMTQKIPRTKRKKSLIVKKDDVEDALATYRGEKRRVVDYTKYTKPSGRDEATFGK